MDGTPDEGENVCRMRDERGNGRVRFLAWTRLSRYDPSGCATYASSTHRVIVFGSLSNSWRPARQP